MFDIGWDELLFTVIIAIVVIGPKDLPRALRFAGQWIGKIRRVSNHFRSGIETMIREAEMEEMEQKWRDQNAKIIAETGVVEPASDSHAAPPAMTGPLAPPAAETPALGVAAGPQPEPASAEAAILPPPP